MAPNIGAIATSGGASALPYPAGSLHPPLSTTQRAKIIQYLQNNGYSLVDITHYAESAASSQTTGAVDGALIQMYNAVSTGGGVSVSNDVSNTSLGQYIWGKYLNPWTASEPGGWLYNENQAVGKSVKNAPGVKQIGSAISNMDDLAKALGDPNTWIRVGEFAAGAILLLVGADALLKGKISNAGRSYTQPKKGVKYAKFAA